MAGKSHKACSFLLLLWVVCTCAKRAPSAGENEWKDLPSLAKSLLDHSERQSAVHHIDDSAENYVHEKRMPPLPFDKRMPPLPFDKRMPPLPFDKRMPPLPFDKRMPPLPFDKRMPPLPFDKRMPPLPFDKRLAAERKRKAALENDVDFDIKSDESGSLEPEGFGFKEGNGYGDGSYLYEKRMPPLPFDKRMPPLPFDKRVIAKWYQNRMDAMANDRSKRTVSGHSDTFSYARAKSAITA